MLFQIVTLSVSDLCDPPVCENVCNNGGTCSCSAGLVTCNCLGDFEGEFCEIGKQTYCLRRLLGI